MSIRSWAAPIGVAAIIASVTLFSSGVMRAGDSDSQVASPSDSDGFDPESVRLVMTDLVDDALGVDSSRRADEQPLVSTFDATDANGTDLDTSDFDKASDLFLTTTTSTAVVTLQATFSPAQAASDPETQCATSVDAGFAESCEVVTTPDGRMAAVSVSKTYRAGEQWMGVGGEMSVDDLEGIIDPTDVWFLRQVEVISGPETVNYVSERVKASTSAEAEALWQLSVPDMAAMAANPGVGIDAPPVDATGCLWTLSQDPSGDASESQTCEKSVT